MYDIVLTGHTHVKRSERIDGVLVVKIIPEASVAVYDSETDEVKFILFT